MSKDQDNKTTTKPPVERKSINEGLADLKNKRTAVFNDSRSSAETITSHFAAPVNPDKTSGNKTKK